MGTTDVLHSSIHDAHQRMTEHLEAAKVSASPPDRPRDWYVRLDTFLAEASKHLHAVDAVLLPAVRKEVPDGSTLVHDYVHAVKELEVVLSHVKAHEYGSVYESSFGWGGVWSDVDQALEEQRRREQELGDRLTEALGNRELQRLNRRLEKAERTAPTRPHPYTPHTGFLGLVARRVMAVADRFWDAAEGRMYPEPEREPKKPPGLVAQYFLGDPRFDEEQPKPR